VEIPFIKWVDEKPVPMLAIQNNRGFRHVAFQYKLGDKVPAGVEEFMKRHPEIFKKNT
tara:strand:- start:358 stop:531 length:174 start_codon:yes stop_codon:yes gene_type:complete